MRDPFVARFLLDVLEQHQRLAAPVDIAEVLDPLPGGVSLGEAGFLRDQGDGIGHQREHRIPSGADGGVGGVTDGDHGVNSGLRSELPKRLLPYRYRRIPEDRA